MEILTNISFDLDFDTLLSRLHVDKGSGYADEVQKLVEEVTPLI